MRRLLLFLGLLSFTAMASAEPWPLGQGRLLVSFEGSFLTTTGHVYDLRGNRVAFAGGRYRESGDTLRLEAGLLPRLTVLFTVPYKKARIGDGEGDATGRGFGDGSFAVRYSVPVGGAFFAAGEAAVVTPLGYSSAVPQIGSGHSDAYLGASLGGSLAFLPEGSASLDVGYRLRGGPIDNEVPYAVRVGAFPHRRIGVFLLARGWFSRAEFGTGAPSAGFLVSDSALHAAGAEVILWAKRDRSWAVNAAWTRSYAGTNAVAGDRVAIGVTYLPGKRLW